MHCAKCKVNKIGPNTEPFGGYLCVNEHLVCSNCDRQNPGLCGICNSGTNFIQMNLVETAHQAKSLPMIGIQNSPATPPTCAQFETNANQEPNPSNDPTYIFPKVIFVDVESQPCISQEKLILHDSVTSVNDNNISESDEFIVGEKPPVPNRSFTKVQTSVGDSLPVKKAETMKTIFIGHQQPQQSAMNLSFFKQNVRKCGGMDQTTNGRCFYPRDIIGDNEDNAEADNIHTSEIRFMESTESLKNYYSGGTAHPILNSPDNDEHNFVNVNPQNGAHLSTRMLHDFEYQNRTNSADLVENYLRNYGPLTVCHFPAYSISHNCYHPMPYDTWSAQQRQQAMMRSISVSTDSEPGLASKQRSPHSTVENSKIPSPSEYVVMQATIVPDQPPVSVTSVKNPDKMARFSLDQRMQRVLGTLQEDPLHASDIVDEKHVLELPKNYNKMPTPETNFPIVEPPVRVAPIADKCSQPFVLPARKSDNFSSALSNSHRAYYNPSNEDNLSVDGQSVNTERSFSAEPAPQFQLISCPTFLAGEMLASRTQKTLTKPMPAYQLNIPRSPMRCPESTCPRLVFVSDFIKHMVVDHTQMPIERISPRQCKNFFLDPRVPQFGINKCHFLYLIRDKIIDLGSSDFKDFLPMLVMSTRVRLTELCGNPNLEGINYDRTSSFLMIWLMGMVPNEFAMYVSLTIWPHSGRVPTCHIVHSGEIYSMRSPQTVMDVYRSGQMLLLSEKELQLLTRDGKDMLEMQVMVH